jgi:hypothetical protein
MAKSTPVYRRLTGRKRSLSGFTQLWLGPGHILLLRSHRFTEEYRRFAFADIQAFVITEVTGRMKFQLLGLVATAALWTLGFVAVNLVFAKAFFGITGALVFAIVMVDIARGPRCQCHVYTAVSRELLAPVSRLRRARTFLVQVRPQIEAVQGRLPTDQPGVVRHPDETARHPDQTASPADETPPHIPGSPT